MVRKMHYLLIPVLILLMHNHESVAHTIHQTLVEDQSIPTTIQDDLKMLNVSCNDSDSCTTARTDEFQNYYGCHCGPHCVQLDTCCLDSPYIGVPKPKMRPNCRSAYNGGRFFMMDRCPSSDSAWEGLCKEEWNGEDDVFRIVPVTSLQTSITYKNYFCFKCHETNEDFVHWNVRLYSYEFSSKDYNASGERVSLKYDSSRETWMAVIGEHNAVSFPVTVLIKVPETIRPLVPECNVDVISNCSEHWADEEVQGKCEAYTAMKRIFRDGWTFTYRNIHCAICNFEMIDGFYCIRKPTAVAFGGVTFSFTHLLDINRKDGDIVGSIQKCDEDYVLDPYANKCRKLTCAIPGYSVRNGKCVAE